MRKDALVHAAVLTPLLLSSVALAQNATTSLRGVVTDASGAAIQGATVSLQDKGNGKQTAATTDRNGEYRFLQIAPSAYTVTVTSGGFGAVTKTADLPVNQPVTINFSLTVNGAAEVVDVTTAAQTLNDTDATMGNPIDGATVVTLPSETRNIPDLLSLNAGVFYLPIPAGSDPAFQDSRSGAVNGARSDQSNVTLDGVDDNDQVRGLAFTGVLRATQDSTEEFRVTTAGANSDAGRSSGAQVSLVTKSGTNKFHGALYEYNRPTITVANDFFLKQAQLAAGLPNRPPKLIRNIFGGDLGGPVFKKRLFFFVNYEGQRQAESAIVQRTVPTASYQQGIIQYTSGGATAQVSPAQVATLDAANGCSVCNTAAYPSPPGVNPAALKFLQLFPAANGTSLGDGLNTGSFTFASPHPISLNTTIVRLDLEAGKHHIFGRGNLQKDITGQVEQFPGQGPSSQLVDNSKGMTFGDTWTLTDHLVNDVRYGYVRQAYASSGVGSGDYVDFRFIDTPTAETRSSRVSVPVNNIIDNLTWNRGGHTFQVGGNWRVIHQNLGTDQNSYNGASSNPYWLYGDPPDPSTLGLGAVDSGFENSYLIAYANLVGTIPEVINTYNYAVSSPTSGTLLSEGAFITRSYKTNEFEWYVQDSWRARPNLNFVFGLRHTILQTPWEIHGQQVQPTIDTHAWYQQREAAAQAGQVYEPNLNFAPSGPYYGKPGYWPKQKDNFAPRFAVAYSPTPTLRIRAGAGIYFDHYGQGLINTYSKRGSFGLSSTIESPPGKYTDATSPRFTDRRTLPFSNGAGAPSTSFPYLYPQNAFSISPGLDNRIKTPYNEAFDLSLQKDLGKGFTLETAYVGRLGRRLIQSLDLAAPVNYVDPKGGGSYFAAGTQLSKLVDQNAQKASASVPAIPFFENVFPFMANYDFPGESATQAIYTNEWAPLRTTYAETQPLVDIDFDCGSGQPIYPCPAGYVSKFWQNQFSSLYSLSSVGISSYNALQVVLRHPMRNGLQMDFNYTYSKSLDWGSDAERASDFNSSVAGENSPIINTWQPSQMYAPSDFDTRHNVTVDYVYQLPFGHDRRYLAQAGPLLNSLVGGWQMSGIFRATSGLPWSLVEPGFTTNWEFESFAVVVDKSKLKLHRHFDSNGNPQYFDNPDLINSGVNTGYPVRLPYPGETGQRNNLRGDGVLSWDEGLEKSWALERFGTLDFQWQVYNVTNTFRFDPFSIGTQLTAGNLGIATSQLGAPRRMQFALRYSF